MNHGAINDSSNLDRSGSKASLTQAPTRFWKVILLVLLAETAAIAIFYGCEWSWLRQTQVLWLRAALEAFGCSVQTAGTFLTVDGHRFQIDPDCTYVDLILCGLPLLWRVHWRLSKNLALLAGFTAAVVVVNLSRAIFGVYAVSRGGAFFWAHDFVDYVLWYPTLGIVAFFWMRSLRPLLDGPAYEIRSIRRNGNQICGG